MSAPRVRVEHVTKAYRQDGRGPPVLDDISAQVQPGEFVVLVGRSGSGKSTLLNLIGAIDLPTAGTIWLDDVEITRLGESGRALLRRQRIGFVFQSCNLIPTLTVGENLRLPLELNGRRGRSASARVRELLAAVGLAHCQSRWPEELSGGEQQRVALARALVHEPQLVLADEPTGNLDLETATEVIALLDRLCREFGTTLVMATHSREVLGRADRVLTIRQARLHEEAR